MAEEASEGEGVVKLFADLFLWALIPAVLAAASAPFAMNAGCRTPGKITVAICSASVLTSLLTCVAWRLT